MFNFFFYLENGNFNNKLWNYVLKCLLKNVKKMEGMKIVFDSNTANQVTSLNHIQYMIDDTSFELWLVLQTSHYGKRKNYRHILAILFTFLGKRIYLKFGV